MKFVFVAVLVLASVLGAFARNLGVIGGKNAIPNQFPFQVSYQISALGIEWMHACGGSLLNENYVLTSANCVVDQSKNLKHRVLVGSVTINDKYKTGQTSEIEETIVHPHYAGQKGVADIALLKLKNPVKYSDNVKPVVLPKQNVRVKGDVILTGWGSTTSTFIPTLPKVLHYATLPVIANNVCEQAIEKKFGKNTGFSGDNICTGPLDGDHGACVGDSGSPLVSNLVQVGIVAWETNPCGDEGYPTVYTRVGSYLDFIRKYVKDDDDN